MIFRRSLQGFNPYTFSLCFPIHISVFIEVRRNENALEKYHIL